MCIHMCVYVHALMHVHALLLYTKPLSSLKGREMRGRWQASRPGMVSQPCKQGENKEHLDFAKGQRDRCEGEGEAVEADSGPRRVARCGSPAFSASDDSSWQ